MYQIFQEIFTIKSEKKLTYDLKNDVFFGFFKEKSLKNPD
jgi:hypothetical protein